MKIKLKYIIVCILGLLFLSQRSWSQEQDCTASEFYNSGAKPCADQIDAVKCINLDITDSYDFDGLEMDFIWDMGDGQKKKGLEVKHCYEKEGVYKASLTVVDLVTKVEIKDELIVDVYIRGEFGLSFNEMDIQAGVSFEPTYNVTYPDSYQLSNYYWSYGDGRFSCEAKPQILYNSANEFPLILNVELISGTDVVYLCQQLNIDAKLPDPTNGSLDDYFSKLEVGSRFLLSNAEYQIVESKDNIYRVVNNVNDLQSGTSYNVLAFKGNLVLKSDEFTVNSNSSEAEKNQIVQETAGSILDKKPMEFVPVIFDLNTSEFSKRVRKPLDANIEMLKQYPFLQIMIGSYTHTGGGFKNNITLSRDRSQLIKSYLVKGGISADRILLADPLEQRALINTCVTKGCEYENPAMNRRSDFKVLGITQIIND